MRKVQPMNITLYMIADWDAFKSDMNDCKDKPFREKGNFDVESLL